MNWKAYLARLNKTHLIKVLMGHSLFKIKQRGSLTRKPGFNRKGKWAQPYICSQILKQYGPKGTI